MDREHPLYGLFPGLWTPDTQILKERTRLGILSNGKGIAVFGLPQIGKTSALRVIREHMDVIAREPAIVLSVTWDHVSAPTDQKFHSAMLSMISHTHDKLKGEPRTQRDRLVNALRLKCVQKNASLIVLIIDEAQIVKIDEFMWLHGVYNSLVEQGLRVFTVLAGQPELETNIDEFQRDGHSEIIGRFMRTVFEFRGLVGTKDLHSVLTWIDRDSEYPAGSGQPYLASVIPKAVANDFQLADYAKAIETRYQKRCRSMFGKSEDNKKIGMSMAIFHSIIKLILLELEPVDSASLTIDKAVIKRCVNAVVVNLR